MSDVIWTDATAQAEAVRTGAVAADLLHEYLDRIERFDPQLRAYVSLDTERAARTRGAADDAVGRGAERTAAVPRRDDLGEGRDRRRRAPHDRIVEGPRRPRAPPPTARWSRLRGTPASSCWARPTFPSSARA